ncbi:AMP-binding protein [Variovorax sp. OV329]|uniref:AMP-binding protein n=1 Tax=Variovorax sp. OV329 TaxID=1882825 RepID=UPI0008EAEB84|nr:AMP-binding protein [Variovorax sp. OV329]SFM94378.1 long-chain acyl-CoA synthetase [Variovorax sp. OV329]
MEAALAHALARLDAATSLADLVEYTCARHGARPAFSQGGRTLGYAEFGRLSAAFADWLRHDAGLQAGDRVALMLPNLLQYPVVLAGVWRAGLVAVNVNPQYTARELAHQLGDSGARVIVAMDSLAALLAEVAAGTSLRHVVLTNADDLLGMGSGGGLPPEPCGTLRLRALLEHPARALPADTARPARDDIALLQYTGGTTGVSKGAMLTHGNLLANLHQATQWYGRTLREGAETVVTILPLYHIFALSFNGLLMLHLGAHNRLVASPRDLAAIAAALNGCTVLSGVNTLYAALLDAPEVAQVDLRGLKLAVAGGTATQPAVAERWLRRTGRAIAEGYGLTEASPFVLSEDPSGASGPGLLPMPDTEVAVCAPDGTRLPPGEPGELRVRGPQVMRGYWGRLDETAETLDAQGWLRTGDVGRMDTRGAFTITDRSKDMVLVSGFNVYPNEVEAVLSSHPGVTECAVVGMPDARTGEAVHAFVVPRAAGLSTDELIAHCRAQLAAYKVPRRIEFVAQLPKSPVGKVLRRLLRT